MYVINYNICPITFSDLYNAMVAKFVYIGHVEYMSVGTKGYIVAVWSTVYYTVLYLRVSDTSITSVPHYMNDDDIYNLSIDLIGHISELNMVDCTLQPIHEYDIVTRHGFNSDEVLMMIYISKKIVDHVLVTNVKTSVSQFISFAATHALRPRQNSV